MIDGTDETVEAPPREDEMERETERAAEVRVVDKRRFARLLGFGAVSPNEQAVESERLPTYVEELKQRA